MPPTTKIEIEKRIRIVQDWVIQDYPVADIVTQCFNKWGVCERQAKRYIKEAGERWIEEDTNLLKMKRARRTNALKRLLQQIDPNQAKSPSGIRAQLAVHKEISLLEGTRPTKQEIEAEVAKSAGKKADPLAPSDNKLIIEVIPPYAQTKAV